MAYQKNKSNKNCCDQCESNDYYNHCGMCHNDEEQEHVHEYSSNVKLAEDCPDRHTHHISGVTGEAMYINGGPDHVHKVIKDNTDFFDHFHQICDTTGPAIEIEGTGKHIHLLCGNTTVVDEHCHKYLFVTQIDAPLI